MWEYTDYTDDFVFDGAGNEDFLKKICIDPEKADCLMMTALDSRVPSPH